METKKNGVISWLDRNVRKNGAAAGLLLVILIGIIVNGRVFLSIDNITNVGRQAAVRGLLACGISLTIISGTIDLSISTLFPLCGLVCLYCSNYSVILAFVVPLLLAAVVGSVNALLITKARIHPWITTIAMQLGLNGVNLLLTKGNTYKPGHVSGALMAFGNFSLFGKVDMQLICLVLVFIVFGYLTRRRPAFRCLYAVGASEEAAAMMGVQVFRARMTAHVLCSLLAGVAGILLVSRSGAGQAASGSGYEMYAIASCVLGGIHLAGGRGNVFGAFLGAWILAFLNNIFNMQSFVNPIWYQVVVGLLVVVVVLAQAVGNRRSKNAG